MEPILGPLIALVGTVAAVYFTYRASTRKLKADSGMQMIDQHQEDIVELRKENAQLRRTTRLQGDYIGQLRKHIADGNSPPPPAWPDGLTT